MYIFTCSILLDACYQMSLHMLTAGAAADTGTWYRSCMLPTIWHLDLQTRTCNLRGRLKDTWPMSDGLTTPMGWT